MTDDEIRAVYNRYPYTEQRIEFARAIIAADRAKLLAGVGLPKGVAYVRDADVRCFGAGSGESSFTFGRHKDWKHPLYSQDQLQQYGDARDQAGYLRGLDDAKRVMEGQHTWITNIAAAQLIEKLKGGE